LKVPIWLHGRSLTAMIDSGAQGSFINKEVMIKHNLPWRIKERPYNLTTLDGSGVAYGDGTI
jgi:hypothetical protein